MGLLTKNREYGYYWTLKGSKWAINEYYQNKWTGGVPDEYWDDIEEMQIVRKEEFKETTSSCTIDSVSGSVECECIESNRTQVSDPNSYPHGEWIEYDKCNDCGKWHNLKVR